MRSLLAEAEADQGGRQDGQRRRLRVFGAEPPLIPEGDGEVVITWAWIVVMPPAEGRDQASGLFRTLTVLRYEPSGEEKTGLVIGLNFATTLDWLPCCR